MVFKLEFIILIFTVIWLMHVHPIESHWHNFLGRTVKTYELTNLCVDVFKYHFQVCQSKCKQLTLRKQESTFGVLSQDDQYILCKHY